MTNAYVQFTVADLPAAKKGRFAGKVRHDALTIRPSDAKHGVPMPNDLPEYIKNAIGKGFKSVVYKSSKPNSAYRTSLRALNASVPTTPINAKSTPKKSDDAFVAEFLAEAKAYKASQKAAMPADDGGIVAAMIAAEAENARRDAESRKLSRMSKADLIAMILG